MDLINNLKNTYKKNKNIVINIVGMLLVKGGAMILTLFTMPAYIRYFNNENILGLWFTILSILTWILIFDLGIGNGLRNNLVEALVRKDEKRTKKYISSAYIVIGIIIIFIYLISLCVFPKINWNSVFNISTIDISPDVLYKVIHIVFLGIIVQFFFRIITSILYALQKSAIPNFLTLCTAVIQLIYVILAKDKGMEQNLMNLSIAYVVSVNLPLIIATFIIFMTTLRESKPNIKYFDKKFAKKIIGLGGNFFIIQIVYMLIMNTNEILISKIYNPDKVVKLQIYNKLFTVVGTLFNIGLTPIWSAVTKAISEKNFNWVNNLYKNLKRIGLLAIISELLLIPFLQIIVNFWLKEKAISINYIYALVFAIFGIVFIWIAILSSIANGLGKLKIQTIFYTIAAIIKIPIIYLINLIYKDWINVIISTIIVMIPFCIVQMIYLNRYLKEKKEEVKNEYI